MTKHIVPILAITIGSVWSVLFMQDVSHEDAIGRGARSDLLVILECLLVILVLVSIVCSIKKRFPWVNSVAVASIPVAHFVGAVCLQTPLGLHLFFAILYLALCIAVGIVLLAFVRKQHLSPKWPILVLCLLALGLIGALCQSFVPFFLTIAPLIWLAIPYMQQLTALRDRREV